LKHSSDGSLPFLLLRLKVRALRGWGIRSKFTTAPEAEECHRLANGSVPKTTVCPGHNSPTRGPAAFLGMNCQRGNVTSGPEVSESDEDSMLPVAHAKGRTRRRETINLTNRPQFGRRASGFSL
jgi:hypothetical protein